MLEVLQPEGWLEPRGYSNGILAEGRTIFVAGQVGWNAVCEFETSDFAAQTRQALTNIVAVLASADASPQHITRMTWYIVDKREYIAAQSAIGKAYREVIGNHFPAMTLVQVANLLEDQAQVEIEATAILPY